MYEPNNSHHLPRRSSLCEKNKGKQEMQKRTTFDLKEDNISGNIEQPRRENASRISPPPPPRIPPRPEIVIDVRKNNHQAQMPSHQEQV